jgi:hypothetical protein
LTGSLIPQPSTAIKVSDTNPTLDPKEPSLSVTQPHVAPAQATKNKSKRKANSRANEKKQQAKEFAIERAGKLEKRRDSVEGKKDKKKKARQLWQ